MTVRLALALLVTLALAAPVAACQPTLREEVGVVISIESAGLGKVDGFELRTADGRLLTFDTRDLAFDRVGFPASHLSEHLATTEPVRVTYRLEDGRNVAVRLVDAPR